MLRAGIRDADSVVLAHTWIGTAPPGTPAHAPRGGPAPAAGVGVGGVSGGGGLVSEASTAASGSVVALGVAASYSDQDATIMASVMQVCDLGVT